MTTLLETRTTRMQERLNQILSKASELGRLDLIHDEVQDAVEAIQEMSDWSRSATTSDDAKRAERRAKRALDRADRLLRTR